MWVPKEDQTEYSFKYLPLKGMLLSAPAPQGMGHRENKRIMTPVGVHWRGWAHQASPSPAHFSYPAG